MLKRHEASEAVLFTCRIYEKMGKSKEALEFLVSNEKLVVDNIKKTEYKALFNEQNGNKEKAIESYEYLLQLNAANLETYTLIFRAKGIKLPQNPNEKLSEVDQTVLKSSLLFYEQKLPRVNSHIRFGLRYLHGVDFSELLDKYIRPLLVKGVPSVIQEIKEFYR